FSVAVFAAAARPSTSASLLSRFVSSAIAQPLLAALPPLRPAAAFCAFVPPWLAARRFVPLPELSPPRLEEPLLLAIRAARSLLMPFSRSPSYCLSFFTLGPWSLAMALLLSAGMGH